MSASETIVREDAGGDAVEARRWSGIGWTLAAVLLAITMVGLFRGVRSHEAGLSIAAAVAKGDRPVAPRLPTVRLSGVNEQVALPVLPAPGSGAVANMRAPIVVNWWASWCGPCREEARILNREHDRYAAQGVQFVGIDAGGEDLSDDARAFARHYDVRYALVRGTKSDKGVWGVTGFPETFVIGRDGRIAARIDGPVERQSLEALIDRELAGPSGSGASK